MSSLAVDDDPVLSFVQKGLRAFLFLLSFATNDMEEIKLIRSEITDYTFTMQLPSSSEYVLMRGRK